MSDFRSFLKGNVKEVESVSLKLNRFDDEIILRPLSAGEADEINQRCFINKPGRKGRQERTFDVVKYNREICVASIVYPDLNNAEFQESYETRGASNLYSKLFLLGEANEILEKVMEISGIDTSMDEEIEQAKN